MKFRRINYAITILIIVIISAFIIPLYAQEKNLTIEERITKLEIQLDHILLNVFREINDLKAEIERVERKFEPILNSTGQNEIILVDEQKEKIESN